MPPLPGATGLLQHHALVIAPADQPEPSKTGTYDDTVVIDSPVWIGQLLSRSVAALQPHHLLFGLRPSEFQRIWQISCLELGIVAHPYQIRHTGASNDFVKDLRSQLEIMTRGRWRTNKSLNRYKKGGPIQRQWNKLPLRVQQLCLSAELNLEAGIIGRWTLPQLELTANGVVRLDR